MKVTILTRSLALIGLLAGTSHAARADFLGKFGDWEAHARSDGGAQVCYAATIPTKSASKYTHRGDVFLLVSHRPAANVTRFISIQAGYPYNKGDKITGIIGGQSFAMFSHGGFAFAYDDTPYIKAMFTGIDLVVQVSSWQGTLTTDTFSLNGFRAAYRAASAACGVN